MQEPRTLGECEFGARVTLITGHQVELVREKTEYPGWLIVKDQASGAEYEYHKTCRLKGA